jgi:hypothetical protein
MMGWALAAVLMLIAAFFMYKQFTRGQTHELTQSVTIRSTKTGHTWQLPRGVMERELYTRPMPIDPEEGLPDPETGEKTGFPVDDWNATVARINKERKAASTAPPPKQAAPK